MLQAPSFSSARASGSSRSSAQIRHIRPSCSRPVARGPSSPSLPARTTAVAQSVHTKPGYLCPCRHSQAMTRKPRDLDGLSRSISSPLSISSAVVTVPVIVSVTRGPAGPSGGCRAAMTQRLHLCLEFGPGKSSPTHTCGSGSGRPSLQLQEHGRPTLSEIATSSCPSRAGGCCTRSDSGVAPDGRQGHGDVSLGLRLGYGQ